jgi:prepilin-type N-terminal cleavage/methylation domain-containing protein
VSRPGLIRRLRREEAGFTLIELAVSMAVLGVLFGVYSLVLSSTIRDGGAVEDQSTAQTQVRAAVDTLAADLRQAYTGDSSGTMTDVASGFTGNTITFYSPDRQTPFHLRKISYQLTGGNLQRQFALSTDTDGYPWTFGATGAWVNQVNNVTNSTVFTYYDSSGNVTSTASAIDNVGITVTVSPRGSQGRTYTYTTTVQLRSAS